MFVGCFEISTSVIVKHIQNIETIRAFCLPGVDLLRFSLPWGGEGGTEEITGLWFARGNQYPGWHYGHQKYPHHCKQLLGHTSMCNMALKLYQYFYLLMEKPLGHYFQVRSPYYRMAQCNQKAPIPVPSRRQVRSGLRKPKKDKHPH